jgi:hypothetical protein
MGESPEAKKLLEAIEEQARIDAARVAEVNRLAWEKREAKRVAAEKAEDARLEEAARRQRGDK